MRNQIILLITFISAFLVLFILVFMFGCNRISSQELVYTTKSPPRFSPIPPIKNQETGMPTLQPTPMYMSLVFPNQPWSKERYDEYLNASMPIGRGVGIEVKGNKLGLKKGNISGKIIAERSMLFINGVQIPNDSLLIADGMIEGFGPYLLSWAPQLAPGLHEATFQFLNDYEEILEYTWRFFLTDE